jgi:hypothetical protein
MILSAPPSGMAADAWVQPIASTAINIDSMGNFIDVSPYSWRDAVRQRTAN